jgi:hypothetical protein
MTQNIVNLLSDALSQIPDVRKNAENLLQTFQQQDNFPQLLLQVCLDQQVPIPVRQMSAVSLKNYIDTNWLLHFNT